MTLGDASDFFLRKNDKLCHGKATPFKSFQLIQVVSTNKRHKNSDSLDEQLSGSHSISDVQLADFWLMNCVPERKCGFPGILWNSPSGFLQLCNAWMYHDVS